MLAYPTVDQLPQPAIEAVCDERATAMSNLPHKSSLPAANSASAGAAATMAPLDFVTHGTSMRLDECTLKKLIREHQALTLKSLTEGLSEQENTRWRMVRWQIDVAQNARPVVRSAALDSLIDQRRSLAGEIQAVVAQLDGLNNGPRPRSRRAGR